MRALIKKSAESTTLELIDVPEPSAGADDIKIRVHATGICGSDIHIMQNEYPSNPPVVMGHEYSGIIEEIGEEVSGFRKGDRVVSVTAVVTCGKCRYCRAGLRMLCNRRLSIGSGVNGAFTEYIVVPAGLAYKIPENVSLDEAALTEPLACVVRGVIERSNIKAGDMVYISGPGIIGQLAMQVAIACGASVTVGGTSFDRERLKLAKQCGALEVIVVDEENPAERAIQITSGYGFDAAFECAGAAASADTCLKVLKKTGLFGQLGLYGTVPGFDMDLALMKEINITNSYASEPTSWETALELMKNGKVDLKPLIGKKYPIGQWCEAFDAVIRKEGYKTLIIPERND